ncbi:MAG: glycosyltransferase family 2 protein [Bacteroidota bacterium]
MSLPCIHIIIPHFGSMALLYEALVSFRKQEYAMKKIIVVNNQPEKHFDDDFSKIFPDVSVLHTSENLGWPGACNYAVQNLNISKDDIILLTNNDVIIPDPQLLDKMISKYFSNPVQPCVVGPSVYHFSEPEKIHNAGWTLFEKSKTTFNNCRNEYEGDFRNETVDYVSGCFMMFPNAVIEKTGLLDETFFMYAEDADFCYTSWKSYIPVFCDSELKILHHIGGEAGSSSSFREYYISRNIYLFLEKHKDHPQYNYFLSLQIKKDRKRVLGLFFRGVEWKLRSAVLDGIRDGRKGVKGLTRKP